MSNIDKQAVQAVADLKAGYTLGHADVAILSELARIALASLEAEPVGYMNRFTGRVFTLEEQPGADTDAQVYVPLYTAPPAPVSVPAAMEMDDDFDSAFEHGKAVGWNAYRAAMLQGADGNAPAHFRSRPAQSSLSPAQGGNSPVIPDGWVACSERMPEAGDDMIVFTDDIVMSGISYSKKKGFYIQALEYDDDEPVDNVTHWMPLPAAPQHK
ncbi:DUF551 domain-containing protein [Enterobacter hormaechei]|uniref:DUF551 domain-containing protein n=1 Tax=Enterobacter hormaechei TaxID=158836 RepID=UPI003EB905A6